MRKNGYRLVVTATGKEVEVGEEFKTQTKQDTTVLVIDGIPPYNDNQGKVCIILDGIEASYHHPAIIGCQWIKDPK